jgi:hypothetical protein
MFSSAFTVLSLKALESLCYPFLIPRSRFTMETAYDSELSHHVLSCFRYFGHLRFNRASLGGPVFDLNFITLSEHYINILDSLSSLLCYAECPSQYSTALQSENPCVNWRHMTFFITRKMLKLSKKVTHARPCSWVAWWWRIRPW